MNHYHVVGVAGAGMNALAQVLTAQGHRVTGSDRFLDQGESLVLLDQLNRLGVELFPQDGSAVQADSRGLIVSTAIEPDNPEILAAQRLGIPVIHRAEMLASLCADRQVMAIAGTSGKTTVTGMTGWILEQAGLDPTVVNGGNVLNWADADHPGNVRIGRSNLWVVEVDESDKSFLRFHPEYAVINNISVDHFGLDETVGLFRTFAGQVKQGIVCSPGVRETLAVSHPRCMELDDTAFSIGIPGHHNEMNARAAATLCREMGVDSQVIHDALASFQGIQRRLELIDRVRGITIYDDYAHNPAKIEAAWHTARALGRRVIGIWRPHGYGPLAAMAGAMTDTLRRTLDPSDRFLLLPVYYAGGTAQRQLTSERFAADLAARGAPASYVDDYTVLLRTCLDTCRNGDVVLCMGARDPEMPRFARRLADALKQREAM